MTALEQYIRLEATGRWREASGEDWREVLVSFGNATLVLSDFSERPLTHWALAATKRVDDDADAALYAPDTETEERLEVSDAQMIEAIAEVTAHAREQSRIGRRGGRHIGRYIAALLAVLVLAGIAVFGPDLLRARALALISPAQSELITQDLLARLPERCANEAGQAALRRFAAPLTDGRPVHVIDGDAPKAAHLPDGSILLAGKPLASTDDPQALAALIGATSAQPRSETVLAAWIDGLPLADLGRFLSSGEVQSADIRKMTRLLKRLPDPPPGDAPDAPDLSDQQWVALTQICGI